MDVPESTRRFFAGSIAVAVECTLPLPLPLLLELASVFGFGEAAAVGRSLQGGAAPVGGNLQGGVMDVPESTRRFFVSFQSLAETAVEC